MKVSSTHQEYLKSMLWANVKYRETYHEMYDHVLTAIEEQPESGLSVYGQLEKIITQDFGSVILLAELEEERAKIIAKQIKKKQRVYLMEYFKFPLVAFTLSLAAITYYMADRIPRTVIMWVVIVSCFLPSLILIKRGVKNAFYRKTIKPSIKDKVVGQIGSLAMSFFQVIVFLPQLFINEDYKVFKQANAPAITVIVIFYLTYCLSFIKLYRNEFKMQLAS